MSLEDRFPGLTSEIGFARVAGRTDTEIQERIFEQIRVARGQGFSGPEISAKIMGRPLERREAPTTAMGQAIQFGEDVGKGFVSGLTLGFVEPEVGVETSIAGRVVGDVAGGLIPGLLAFGATAPLRALRIGGAPLVRPLEVVLRSGAAGAILGGVSPAEDIGQRLEQTVQAATLGTLIGAAFIPAVLARPTVRPRVTGEIPASFRVPQPDAPVSQVLKFAGEHGINLGQLDPALIGVIERGELTRVPPRLEPQTPAIVPESAAQPLPTAVTAVESAEAFAEGLRTPRLRTTPATRPPVVENELAALLEADAARSVQLAREAQAAALGPPPKPQRIALPPRTMVVREGGKLLFEPLPEPPGKVTTFQDLKAFASERGYDLSADQTPTGLGFKLVGRGGEIQTFVDGAVEGQFRTALSQAREFLGAKPRAVVPPVERVTAFPDKSTLEKVVLNEELTAADRQNLRDQGRAQELQQELDPYGLIPKEVDQVGAPLIEPTLTATTSSLADLPKAQIRKAVNPPDVPAQRALFVEAIDGSRHQIQDLPLGRLTPDLEAIVLQDGSTIGLSAVRRIVTKRGRIMAEAPGPTPSPAEPPRPIAGAAGAPRVRFIGPFDVIGSPLFARSPTIRFVADQTWRAGMGMRFRMAGWFKARQQFLVQNLESRGSKLDAAAFDMAQGERISTDPRVVNAVEFYNRTKKDFARRLGLPEWDNYATHVTDFDAMLAAMREELIRPFDDLHPDWRLKLDSQSHAKHVNTLRRHQRWQDIPQNLRRDIKADLFEWDNIITNWDMLPPGVKARLPREVFSPYMLPRIGTAPFKRSLIEAFDRYVPIMEHKASFDPVLNAVRPIIEGMPGSEIPFSERWFLNNYVERVILRRPSSTERVVSTMVNHVNEKLGKQLVDPDILNQIVGAFRRGVYRGALGIDSAFVNLTQSVNTWAETGRLPIFKFIAKRTEVPDIPGVTSELLRIVEGEGTTVRGRLTEIDQAVTRIVLSPFRITEFVNRGIAYTAGLEESLARGLEFKQANVVGMGRASEVVPNLELATAQIEAMRTVLKTQFGFTPGVSSPLVQNPLGRLSTIFLTYPTRQLQFLGNGIVDALATRSQGKLIRFLALTGFTAGAPALFSQVGIDVRNTWGKGFISLYTPVLRFFGSGYEAVRGGSVYSRARARRDLLDSVGTFTIPQFRYGKKVNRVLENIERGFAVDRLGRRLYDTTPAGELLRLVGLNPEEAFIRREQARGLREFAQEFRSERAEAIAAIIDGDGSKAVAFAQRWGQPITSQEILDFRRQQMLPPDVRALQQIRRELRPRALEETR